MTAAVAAQAAARLGCHSVGGRAGRARSTAFGAVAACTSMTGARVPVGAVPEHGGVDDRREPGGRVVGRVAGHRRRHGRPPGQVGQLRQAGPDAEPLIGYAGHRVERGPRVGRGYGPAPGGASGCQRAAQ